MLYTTAMTFLDTNILLYAISTDATEQKKNECARQLLERTDIILSVQVLQEFYVQATRKSRPDRLSHDQANCLIESWLRFELQEITVPILQAALATCRRWNISYWDAAIIESARMKSCSLLYSEDLQHGMDFAGVRIINPFR